MAMPPRATVGTQVELPLRFSDGYTTTARVFSFGGLIDGREHLAFALGDSTAPRIASGRDAVPLICNPGDVAMTNRQAVHGSFANTSRDWRVTVNFGFHRRRSVLGVIAPATLHGAAGVYDEQRIERRARVIGYAIDARRQRFPHETPFVYQPHAAAGLRLRWDEAAKASMKDYNLLDLSI